MDPWNLLMVVVNEAGGNRTRAVGSGNGNARKGEAQGQAVAIQKKTGGLTKFGRAARLNRF